MRPGISFQPQRVLGTFLSSVCLWLLLVSKIVLHGSVLCQLMEVSLLAMVAVLGLSQEDLWLPVSEGFFFLCFLFCPAVVIAVILFSVVRVRI